MVLHSSNFYQKFLNNAPNAPRGLPQPKRLKQMYAVSPSSLKPEYGNYHLPKSPQSMEEMTKAAPPAERSINPLQALQKVPLPFGMTEQQKQLLIGAGLVAGVLGAAYIAYKTLK